MDEALRSNQPHAGKPSVARAEEILKCFNLKVPQVQPPVGYGLALGALVCALMVLPALYLALIAFLGWLVVWHGYETVAWLPYGPFFIFHLPMALLGALLTIFLVKALFLKRRGSAEQLLTISPSTEPALFQFVHKLCDATGAIAPVRIEVDCEPNAAARFERGIFGLARKQLVLRIGLPLAARLPADQFAGVIVHELGHFNQRSGMLGSYLIRALSVYFARIVFERDHLDQRLERLKHRPNVLMRLLHHIVFALVEMARGVLWLMMIVANLLTCSVLRRMEHDADRGEATITGSRNFDRTSRLLAFLDLSTRRSHYDIAIAWEQHRLPDDLPGLIVANARELSEHRKDILKLLHAGRTRWFDTHPAHDDRVKYVQQFGAEGLVQCPISAKYLFRDFNGLCKASSAAYYRSVVGDEIEQVKFVATADWVREQQGQQQTLKALNRYFQGCATPWRPILPAELPPPPESAALVTQRLRELREALLAAADTARAAQDPYEKAEQAIAVARGELLLGRVRSQLPRAAALRSGAESTIRQQQVHHDQAESAMIRFERVAAERLNLALSLLVDPRLGPANADRDHDRAQVDKCLAVAAALQPLLLYMPKLRDDAINLRVLCSAHNPEQPFQQLVDKILAGIGDARVTLIELKQALGCTAYPFDHATEGISMGDAIVRKLPEMDDPVDAHNCLLQALDGMCNLVMRTMAALVERAERAEAAAGLEPLAEPPVEKTQPAAEDPEQLREQRQYWLWYGARAVAGVGMLGLLVWLSLSPPVLPSMPWSGTSGTGYRPAAFHVPYQAYSAPRLPLVYPPGVPRTQNYPMTHQPYTPGQVNLPGQYSPGQPYNPNQPYTPGPYVPGQAYQPSPYSPGQPNRPGQPYNPAQPNRPGQYPGAQPPRPPVPQPRAPQPSRPQPPSRTSPGAPRPGPGPMIPGRP